jgi:hypothetical protein
MSVHLPIPARSNVPVFFTVVSFAAQVGFRIGRQAVFQNLTKQRAGASDRGLALRDRAIKLFLGIEFAASVIFLALTKSNRWYAIPAMTTLAHALWTSYSYRKEELDNKGDYISMDGYIFFLKD